MLVTKHAAELLALLVNDLYGELPSRLIGTLLNRGRLSITQLARHTQLTPKFIRHGLGVLIQQNLLYHYTNPDSKATSYEVNTTACYNLLRFGRILEVVEDQYGNAERDLVQTLLLLGHARVADLVQAFEARAPKVNGHTNGSHESSSDLIHTEGSLKIVLARLLQAEIIETVRSDSFMNPKEVYHEIEVEIMTPKPGEKAASKANKVEQQQQVMDRYRKFSEQSKVLKRQLDQTRGAPSAKRRKLQNGGQQNGHAHDDDDEAVPYLHPNVIVRVNHEKCLVELRNQSLANFATDAIGEVTGEVYRVVLGLVTAQVARCRADPLLGDEPQPQVAVTTLDIFDQLGEEVNVGGGMGKAPKDKIDVDSAEKVVAAPPDVDGDSDVSDDDEAPVRGRAVRAAESSDDDFNSDEDEAPRQASRSVSKTNGDGPSRVKFDESTAPKQSRIDRMRQHLLLLAESRHRFIRHCGTVGRGQWTVDFGQLLDRLRNSELDAFIEQSFGRHGLRLTRILREKGKLDEKLLHSSALMKKSDVQGKMLAMQMAGLVDVQEVPKDASRMANRTLFFWFFDADRTRAQLLDDVYKATLRCLQTLQVERHRERNILSFVERADVKGKEEEVMTAEHYNKYNRHLETQEKLLGQVMRLDDMVAVLKDY